MLDLSSRSLLSNAPPDLLGQPGWHRQALGFPRCRAPQGACGNGVGEPTPTQTNTHTHLTHCCWPFSQTFEVGVAVRDLLFLSSEPSVLYLAASSPTSSSLCSEGKENAASLALSRRATHAPHPPPCLSTTGTTRLYRHNINKGPIPDLASAAGKKACIFEASRVHQWAAQLEVCVLRVRVPPPTALLTPSLLMFRASPAALRAT